MSKIEQKEPHEGLISFRRSTKSKKHKFAYFRVGSPWVIPCKYPMAITLVVQNPGCSVIHQSSTTKTGSFSIDEKDLPSIHICRW
jgi:hypothetical protein